jgi:uncharacterized Tic20 family protein
MSYEDPAAPYGQPYSRPTISPGEERTWGMLGHVCAIAAMVFSAGLLGFLGSLAIFVLFKDRGPFVRAHAANSLNVQITMLIWLIISIPLILALGLGLLTLFAAPIVAFVLHVVGAVKAYQGEWWNPPLTPRFVR